MTDESELEAFSPDERRQLAEWSAARQHVIAFFEERGLMVSNFSATPILVADDMLGASLIEVEAALFCVLHPDFIDAFRRRLADIPKYAVTLQILNKDRLQKDWPRMGLSFYQGKISDGLKREYLPPPYNTVRYTNSRPDDRPDLPLT